VDGGHVQGRGLTYSPKHIAIEGQSLGEGKAFQRVGWTQHFYYKNYGSSPTQFGVNRNGMR